MNIYIAYRTGYAPNNRLIKTVQADSIFDWFIQNRQQLQTDNYTDVLGFEVYGFPFYSDTEIPAPKDYEELCEIISEYAYSNEVEGNEHCIQIATDDDEIELAWYVFDETFKQQHYDKVALWFATDSLDIHTSETSENNSQSQLTSHYDSVDGVDDVNGLEDIEMSTIKLSDDEHKSCYLSASPIFDGGNLEDTAVVKVSGVHLCEFVAKLREFDIQTLDDDQIPYSIIETLKYLQKIANLLQTDDFTKVIEVFNRYPQTEIPSVENFDLDTIENSDLRNKPDMSLINISDNIVELGINSIGEFYNYYVVFDNIWMTNNPSLAHSILHFGKGWEM